jgi:hypothetical protein
VFNVDYKVNGTKLLIEVDLSKKALDAAPPSSTGKTRLVGTTAGYQPVALTGVTKKVAMALTVTVKD